LLNSSGEGKKSREGIGYSSGGVITGDGKGTEEEKEEKSASTPREVPSNFSAVVAPVQGMQWRVRGQENLRPKPRPVPFGASEVSAVMIRVSVTEG